MDFLGVLHGLTPHDVWVGAVCRPGADVRALRVARNRALGLPDDEETFDRQLETALADPRGSQRLAAEYLRELGHLVDTIPGGPVACPKCGTASEELAAVRNQVWITYLCLSPAHPELCWHVRQTEDSS
jgi:hypothetical protein